MKLTLASLVAGVVALAASAASVPAFAQGTWNLGGTSCNAAGTPAEASCALGSVTAGIQAWGNTGSGTNFVQYNLGEFDPNGFGAQQVSGNETGTNSHHAFDNVTTGCGSAGTTTTGCGGTVEFMLLNFGSAKVNLSAMQIGYTGGDADVSIFRWDGNTAGTPSGSTLSSSWKLVSSMDVDTNGTACTNPNGTGNYCKNFSVGDSNADIVGATNLYSSWWLISTYSGSTNATKGLETGNDAFKILGFTANTCASGSSVTGGSTGGGSTANNNNGGACTPNSSGSVPEPGSLALAGLALVGVYAARRKSAQPMRQLAV